MTTDVLSMFHDNYVKNADETMTLNDYLELCKTDKMAYASAAERMLKAIGKPEIVDTSKDERLSRIFANKKIKTYPAFKDFYGVEEAIEQIVAYFKHAAQGLEERKQILYLLGPVGGGKSSLAEKLKSLMEQFPIYTISAVNRSTGEEELSPVLESPLGLFNPNIEGKVLEKEYGIHTRYTSVIASPWATKRLEEHDGDLKCFNVVKLMPSILRQRAITKTEPGDENNQDIANLVGKVDIRKLEDFSQDDPDAYSYAGGLNIATQGILEFVEMFKAPLKMLHPLLTATQEGNYNGTQGFGAIPFSGIILAHSNESEWESFRTDRRNEAFLDRVCIVKVPYCLRYTEEEKIYEKLLAQSELANAPCAPSTLNMLAKFAVMSRLTPYENEKLYIKAASYDGQDVKSMKPNAKTIREFREAAGLQEGMDGVSTRFAYKILSKVFNFDTEETAANPVHLLAVLERSIKTANMNESQRDNLVDILKNELAPRYAKFIESEIQKAYLDSYDDYGQNLFERYISYADAWKRDEDFRDPDTNEMYSRSALNEELEKLEKPANISNPREFRDEVVSWVLRFRAENGGQMPNWKGYQKIKKVIESRMFSNTEELLPIISYSKKGSAEDEDKHTKFVARMIEMGYTERQTRILVEWYVRYRKHS